MLPSTPFQTLHESFGNRSIYEDSGLSSSRRSSTSSALVDIEPLSGYDSTPSLLRHAITKMSPASPSTRLVDAVFIAKKVVPSSAPAQLLDTDVPTANATIMPSSSTFVDPDMPEGVSLSPPPSPSQFPTPVELPKNVHTAPITRRSALSSSDATSVTKKRGRRVSISDTVCIFNEQNRGREMLPVITEEGSGGM